MVAHAQVSGEIQSNFTQGKEHFIRNKFLIFGN